MATSNTLTSSNGSGTVSVSNMIMISDLAALASNVAGQTPDGVDLASFGLLYGLKYNLSRVVGTGAGGQLDSTSKVTSTPLIISIASGVYIPNLEQAFIKGTAIQKMTVVYLINSNGTSQISEQLVFDNSYILNMTPAYDNSTHLTLWTLTIRYTAITDTNYSYSDTDGTLKGQNESTYNFSTNTTSVGG